MGISLSRRCFRCKAVIGWDAKHCAYCQYREGNDNEDRRLGADEYRIGNRVPFRISETTSQVMNSVRAALAKIRTKRLWL